MPAKKKNSWAWLFQMGASAATANRSMRLPNALVRRYRAYTVGNETGDEERKSDNARKASKHRT